MPEQTLLPDPSYPSKLESLKPHSSFSDYTAVNKQIYVRPSDSPDSIPSTSPTIIILYSWGDSNPKHVIKYADGYRTLYPHARLVIVFGPILKAITQTLETRTKTMAPVIDAAFGPSQGPEEHRKERVMITAMSNTGGINAASTLHAYRRRFGVPMPHRLLICDSTPGSSDFFPNVGRWSRAMALGAARFFPWPFVVTQGIAVFFLAALHGLCWVFRIQSAAEFSVEAVSDASEGGLSSLDAGKLYLYSRDDEIILWSDIEEHAAQARERGFDVQLELFEGTPHVGHMKVHTEQYWGAIEKRWRELC
jgi:hypothetical protein